MVEDRRASDGSPQKKFGRNDLVAGHRPPYFYLNTAAITSAGVDLADVERFVADELMKIPGIAYARTDIAATLATYLGVKPPSGSVGSVLTEVLP